MKYLTVIGNVGKKPEVRETKVGPVVSFGLAQNNWDGSVTWYRISVFAEKGADVAKNLTPGETVAVTGAYKPREWEGKVQHEITATNWLAIEWPFAFGKSADQVPF
jgi:single-stranded DNA-binding protein